MILEMEHVTGIGKNFRLTDISFALPEGYIMGLKGRNGSGKTTLLNYVVNPIQQYTGVIRINGDDIRSDHVRMMEKIGFVSEQNTFLMALTVTENGEILGKAYETWNKERFHAALKEMEVPRGKAVGLLSRGEQLKFQTAFAIAHDSRLYLLDEVTAGMDPVFRIDYFKILHKIIEDEHASIIMTSHIEEEISQKMDYVGVLENGRLISFGEVM
jgi:ABC-2 type transport system ATP-binding protein